MMWHHARLILVRSLIVSCLSGSLSLDPDPATADEQPAEVTARVGIHDDFDRLVFDWPEPVGYRVARTGDVVTISFARPAALELVTIPEDFGERLLAAPVPPGTPTTTFQVTVADDTTVDAFDYDDDGNGHKIVIDVADAPEGAAADEVEILPRGAQPATPPASGGPEAAYQAAFEAMLADPSDAEASFNFVEAATAVGDVRGAIAALERILLVNPNLANIKLELGVLYRRVGADELAESYLAQALEAEDVPADVRARADVILEGTEAEVAGARSPHRFGGSLFLGGRYETNANAAPGDDVIRLFGFEGPFLDDEDTEQDDVSAVAVANLDYAYDFGTQAGHALEANLLGLASRYKEQTDVNTSLIEGELGPRFYLGSPRAPVASVRPFVVASYLELDDEEYRTAYGGGVNGRSALGPVGLNVTLRSLRQEFSDTGERPNASDQTGYYTTLRPNALLEPLPGTVLGAGLVLGYNNADEDYESFIEAGASLFATQYFGKGLRTEKPLSATLGGSYRRTDYDDPDIQVDPDTERADDRYDLSLSFDLPVTDRFTFSLSGQQTWNESNIPNDDYDNTACTAGVTFDF